VPPAHKPAGKNSHADSLISLTWIGKKAPGHRPICAQIKLNVLVNIHPFTDSPILQSVESFGQDLQENNETRHDVTRPLPRMEIAGRNQLFLLSAPGRFFFNPVNPVNPVESIVFFGFPDRIYRV
jgi:hypothetical protein